MDSTNRIQLNFLPIEDGLEQIVVYRKPRSPEEPKNLSGNPLKR
ncbi:hypothetical protein [Roseiconus lacunae]|nr:hypothetical protein [Roseiconus lacunae]